MNDKISSEQMYAWKTKDLNQAAFVLCQEGTKLVNLTATEDLTVFFHFNVRGTEESLSSLLLQHINGDTLVEPQQFVAKQNILRDRLHNAIDKAKKERRNK